MIETLEMQLEKWKKALLVYLGAGSTLLLVALIDLPAQMLQTGGAQFQGIDGWYGLWFILLIACLAPGVLLLAAPRWRKSQLADRTPTGFGFLGVAWLAMLGFSLHGGALLPVVFHFLVFALGVILGGAYLLLRRRPRKEEMFP